MRTRDAIYEIHIHDTNTSACTPLLNQYGRQTHKFTQHRNGTTRKNELDVETAASIFNGRVYYFLPKQRNYHVNQANDTRLIQQFETLRNLFA